MNIYDDPEKYARTVCIPVKWAEIWCANQRKLGDEMEKARICPKCGKATLVFETGSYEEGYSDYIYCENDEIPSVDEDGEEYFEECGYTADPKRGDEALAHWYDFDILLAMSVTKEMWESNFDGLQDWIRFARKHVEEITPKVAV